MGRLGEWFLIAMAFLTLGTGAYWLAREVQTVAQPSNEAQLAQNADPKRLKELTPANGWFPAPRTPLFDWEKGREGWALENPNFSVLSSRAEEGSPEPEEPSSESADKNALSVNSEIVYSGKKSLTVPVHFPDSTTVYCSARPLQGVRFIAYEVYVPKGAPGYLSCLFFLKDKDGRWFQARSRTRLRPGQWNQISADLRAESADVEPLAHLGHWDENQASQIKTVGLTFFGDQNWTGNLQVDDFRGWVRADRFQKMAEKELEKAAPAPAPSGADATATAAKTLDPQRMKDLIPLAKAYQHTPLKILNLRSEPSASTGTGTLPEVEKFHSFTLRFDLNREIYNPFDPKQADVRVLIETPSGKQIDVTGFWYQDFESYDRFASEELRPIGRPEWRVRFTPSEEGEHKISLRIGLDGVDASAAARPAPLAPVKDKDGKEQPPDETKKIAGITVMPTPGNFLEAPVMRFKALPSKDPGFVRISKIDPRCFEYDNGDLFYPLGMNTHSPVDIRCWTNVFHKETPLFRGIKMYEDFFQKMEKNGVNSCEIWMSSWWLGIEWTRQWRDYFGVGRYSLEHAWKLDKVMELARQHGIRIHLTIDNHGKISDWCDEEWALNPYNKTAYGDQFVATPGEFLASRECRDMHKRRLRYISSRWGGDTYVMGWEMVSECDLIGERRYPGGVRHFHQQPVAREWLTEMMTELRNIDPYHHPLTNHYATTWDYVDLEVANTPLFDYIVCDAYRPQPGFAPLAIGTSKGLLPSNKPFMVTEYGGEWSATTEERLEADLHCGLWGTYMSNAAGGPYLWWYDFVDQCNCYWHYKALANFAKGEERRGLNAQCEYSQISGNAGGLEGLTYRWKKGAYVFVFDKSAMDEMPALSNRRTYKGAEVTIPDLELGQYHVEYWDTYVGEKVKEEELDNKGTLRLKVPDFVNDIAVKVKKNKNVDAERGMLERGK